MEIFYSNSYPLEAVNYCGHGDIILNPVANISVDVAGVLDPPLTTVYYLIILKQYFSNV